MISINEEVKTLNKTKILPRAKALYLALMEYSNSEAKCKPILDSLVFKSGLSESSVIRATKELEAAGLISVVRFNKRGPSTPPNVYTLTHRTKQSLQIDSSSPVKLTGKNTNNIDKNTNSSTITNACHHDNRGKAPIVMDDRLEKYNIMLTILKKHSDFIDHETESEAHYVVDLIELEGLESELRKRRSSRIAKGEYQPPVIQDLRDIRFEIRSASLLSEEPEESCTGA